MDMCRTVGAILRMNFQRWKGDRRVWIVFLFVASLLVQELYGFTQYGLDSQQKCTIYLLPLLFSAPGISIGSMKVMLYLGCLILLCDAPFIYQNTPYMILRSGRTNWCIGEALYIILATFLYLLFITVVSAVVIFPVATLGDSWGQVVRDMTYGAGGKSALDLRTMYQIYLNFPRNTMSYLLPAGTQMYTFLTVWISFIVLGLIQYLVNLATRSRFLGFAIAGVFVFLDPILSATFLPKAFRWLQIFSPVCWSSTENLKMVDRYNFLTVPLVTVMFGILTIALLVGIYRLTHRVVIDVRKDE